MKCFQCGCELSDKDFCTGCGADVKLYKRIMYVANRFYNDGLNKAGVRDLSGAIVSLRQALKFNKNHVEARNLLGLVYFEMGETVAALSEWVISKNIRSQKNIADDYINDVQSNPTRLETINQTVKKYNQALSYCYAESSDLAIIQLKKVVSLNPRFVKAHQLLALLYMNSEEWEKAQRILYKSLKVDVNNTTTLRYLKEVEFMLEGDETAGVKRKKQNVSKDAVTYQSGNETIIQPISPKEPIVGVPTILNVVIGIAIGLAVCYFLVVPARVQSARAEADEQLRLISENSDEKTAQITDLEQRVEALTDENAKQQEQITSYAGEGGRRMIHIVVIREIIPGLLSFWRRRGISGIPMRRYYTFLRKPIRKRMTWIRLWNCTISCSHLFRIPNMRIWRSRTLPMPQRQEATEAEKRGTKIRRDSRQAETTTPAVLRMQAATIPATGLKGL